MGRSVDVGERLGGKERGNVVWEMLGNWLGIGVCMVGGIGEEGVCVIGVDGGKDEGSVPEASSSSRGGGRGGDGSFTRYVYQCQSVCVVGRLPTLPSEHHNL